MTQSIDEIKAIYKDKIFVYHQDAAHGWLEVPKELVSYLGLDKKITAYSYQDEKNHYLEEDQDASVFFKAYKDMFLKGPSHVSKYQNHSFIRGL